MENFLEGVQQLVTSADTAGSVTRAVAYGTCLVALDVLICNGPLKRPILRFFSISDPPSSPKARRLVSQVAAKLVGCVFLAMMFPHAFRTLASKELQADKLYATNADSSAAIVLAAGYFLYDLFICTVHFDQNGHAFLLHGVLCCAAYWYPILSGHLHYMGASYLMWELSTPFLYLRWVVLKAGHANGKWMQPANVAFVLAFFACRIVYGPIMSWDFWVTTQRDLANPRPGAIHPPIFYVYYTAMGTLNTLNYYWFFQMVSMALGWSSSDKDFKNKAA